MIYAILGFTSHRLQPVLITGLYQVWVSDDPAWQCLPEKGQILHSYPGERQPLWSSGRGRRGSIWSKVKLTGEGRTLWTAASEKKLHLEVNRWESRSGQESQRCPQLSCRLENSKHDWEDRTRRCG